jgi:hypothetical protein
MDFLKVEDIINSPRAREFRAVKTGADPRTLGTRYDTASGAPEQKRSGRIIDQGVDGR